MRFLFYSHDGLGLGHTRRNLAIATALTQLSSEARVLLATGVDEIHEFQLPANVDTLKLPSLRKVSIGNYVGRRIALSSSEILTVRSRLLKAAVESFRPSVLLADKHPLGASGELREGLNALREQNGRAVLGLRDVLDDGPTVVKEWELHGLSEQIVALYELVLIYGQASFFDVGQEYRLPAPVVERSRFCGYVVTPDGSWPPPELPWAAPKGHLRPTVLATAGGGEDGFFVLEKFLRACMGSPWQGIVVAGPMAPPRHVKTLECMAQEAKASFYRFVPRLANHLLSVDALVCMGGYNTLAEAMAKAIPTVCVPRISPRMEQFIRAQAFAKAGLLQVIHPDKLSVELLQSRIAAALQTRRTDIEKHVSASLQLDGATKAASYILTLAAKGPAAVGSKEEAPLTARERTAKIAYVVKRYPRYSETFIVNEILAHEAAGLSVEIFSLHPPMDTHFQNTISLVRAPVHYLPGEGSKVANFWAALGAASAILPGFWRKLARFQDCEPRDVLQGITLARLARERGISHLHAHFGSSPATVARIAAHFAEIPYTLTLHAKDIYHESVVPADLRRKLSGASAVVTVSDYNAAHLRQEFGDIKISRIYNGLDLSRFCYNSPAERPPLIVGVGRLVEKKGFDDLVHACRLLAQKGCSFHCLIIGAGEMAAALQRLISDHGLEGRVKLAGPCPQSETMNHIQRAAVLAAPCVVGSDGNRDGLPTVLIEAMALGTPCVATDVTGVPEIVKDQVTGLVVPQRDTAALATAIERLLHDASLRVRLAERARALVEAEFEVGANTAQLRKLFATEQK